MTNLIDAISPVRLITGDDPNLVYKALNEYIAQIEELVGKDPERVIYQAGECKIEDVIVSWSQNFMFSSCAIIILRSPSALLVEELESLRSAIESYGGDNYLVLANFTGTVDKNLVSLLSKRRFVNDVSMKKSGEKSEFLGKFVNESGLNFDSDAYRLLVRHLGEDVSRAMPIIETVKARVGPEGHVTAQVLIDYLSDPGSVAPWDFTDAIEAGKVGESIDMLWRLMRSGKRHPLVIISVIQKRLVELAAVSGSRVRTTQEALEAIQRFDAKFRRPPFVVKKLLETSKRLGFGRISKAFIWLSIADRQVKGEGGLSPEMAVELLVARLAKSFGSVT